MAQRERAYLRMKKAEEAFILAKETRVGYYETKQELQEARRKYRELRPAGTVSPDTIGLKTKATSPGG